MAINVQNKGYSPTAAQPGSSAQPTAQAQADAQQVKDALWRASQDKAWGSQFQSALNNSYLSENLARGSTQLPSQSGPDPFAGLSASDLAQAKQTITQAVQGLSLGSDALTALASAGLVPAGGDAGQSTTAGSGSVATGTSTSGSVGSGTTGSGGATAGGTGTAGGGVATTAGITQVGGGVVGPSGTTSAGGGVASPSGTTSAGGGVASPSGTTSTGSSGASAGAGGATPAGVAAAGSAGSGSIGDVKQLLTAALNGQPGQTSGRSLAGPAQLSSWGDAQYSQLQQGIATAQQFYPQIAPGDLSKLIVAEGAQESSGNYSLNVAGAKPGDGQGFMQVTSQSVIQDFRNYGTAIKAPDGTTVVDPKGNIDTSNVAQNVALWAWYTHNAVSAGQSLDQEQTWSPGAGDKTNQDFGNAQLKWFAGPSNDRHTAGGAAAYDDYSKRVSDYFVQSGFGTADQYNALINTSLAGSPLMNVQKNASPTRNSTYDDSTSPYNTKGASTS